MLWHQLVFFIGMMTVAYIISELSHALAKKLEHTNKLTFLVMPLIVVYYFSAIASLFVGLFMHFQKEDTEQLHKTIEDLKKQLHNESVLSETTVSNEAIYYTEAANGMTVRVPENKIDEWLEQQEAIRNGTSSPQLTEAEQRLVDSIVQDLYGDPEGE